MLRRSYASRFMALPPSLFTLYVSSFVKAGTTDVKYDADDTGYGWKSDVRIDAKDNILPTICKMERP